MQGEDLSDGFEEVFCFKQHMSDVRGFKVIETQEENDMFSKDRKDTYLSWDIGGVMMWERWHANGKKPVVKKQFRFPKMTPGFITAMVFVKPLNLFVAAALDMSFKLYTRDLVLIDSISHEERAMLAMEYHEERQVIIMAGATGVSMWRIYRTSLAKMEYLMERLYKFTDYGLADKWISRMSLDVGADQVYAFEERSAYVIDLKNLKCKYALENIHESTVTCICWYERSQFYMTGCVGGVIKCWTALHFKKAGKIGLRPQGHGGSSDGDNDNDNDNDNDDDDDDEGEGKEENENGLSLLHTFNVHTAAIAGVILHPVSGMGVSAGMDGVIHVLNLEMFTIIYTINLHGPGIRNMTRINLKPHGKMGILFEDENNDIRLWKFSSVAGFFGIASADVTTLTKFEDMQVGKLADIAREKERAEEKKALIIKADFFKHKEEENAVAEQEQLDVGRRTKMAVATAAAFSSNVSSFEFNFSSEIVSKFVTEEEVGDHVAEADKDGESEKAKIRAEAEAAVSAAMAKSHKEEEEEQQASTKRSKRLLDHKGTTHGKGYNHHHHHAPYDTPTYIVALAGRDLRLFTERGRTISCMDPEVVVDGIVAYTVSVSQQLLFCLFDSGALKVYCVRSGSEPGEWSELVCEIPRWNTGVGEHEKATCMALVNELPLPALKPSSTETHRFSKDLRGDPVPENVEELIAVGTDSGQVVFLDTLNDCKTCHVMQGRQGGGDQDCVEDIRYRFVRKELFTTGRSPGGKYYSIRAWLLPQLTLVCEVVHLPLASDLQNAFAISHKLPYFGVGCKDGDARIFVVMDNKDSKKGNGGNGKGREGKLQRTKSGLVRKDRYETADGNDSSSDEEGLNPQEKELKLLAENNSKKKGTNGQMEVMFRSGDLHNAPVTALDFSDELSVYATASADHVVKVWTCEKQILRTIQYNMPTVCLCFNDGLAPGDCIFSQHSYLLNIQRKLWDHGDILQATRDHVEPWIDKGLGAGLFKADDEAAGGPVSGPPSGGAAKPTISLKDTAHSESSRGESGGQTVEEKEAPLSAYFLRRKNKNPAAVRARAKMADQLVANVATPWRSKTSKLTELASTAKYKGDMTSPRFAAGDGFSDDGYSFDEHGGDRDWDPLDTARPPRGAHGAKQGFVLPSKGLGGRLQADRLDDPNNRAPSPHTLRLGFEPSDPAHTRRNFAASPGNMMHHKYPQDARRGQGGKRSSFEMMQNAASIGLGHRGTALLLSNDNSWPSSHAPATEAPHRRSGGTPNRRGRNVRIASKINMLDDDEANSGGGGSGDGGGGSRGPDVDVDGRNGDYGEIRATSPIDREGDQLRMLTAGRVPQSYYSAKRREKQLSMSRNTILSIGRRPMDLNSLADKDFNDLEIKVASPR